MDEKQYVEELFQRHYPNYYPKQVDSNAWEIEVPIYKCKTIKLFGFFPWNKKIPTGKLRTIVLNQSKGISFFNNTLKGKFLIGERNVCFGLDKIDYILYWKFD